MQAIFLYIGAILPWSHFGGYFDITPWRLVVLGLCVMIARRLPWVLALVSAHAIFHLKLANPRSPTSFQHYLHGKRLYSLDFSVLLVRFPDIKRNGVLINSGVGAIFYTQVALEVIPDDGSRERLRA